MVVPRGWSPPTAVIFASRAVGRVVQELADRRGGRVGRCEEIAVVLLRPVLLGDVAVAGAAAAALRGDVAAAGAVLLGEVVAAAAAVLPGKVAAAAAVLPVKVAAAVLPGEEVAAAAAVLRYDAAATAVVAFADSSSVLLGGGGCSR